MTGTHVKTHLAIPTNLRYDGTCLVNIYHCRRLSKENWRAFHLKKPIIIRIPNEVIVISSLKQQGIWISRKDNAKIRNTYNQLYLLIASPCRKGLFPGLISRLSLWTSFGFAANRQNPIGPSLGSFLLSPLRLGWLPLLLSAFSIFAWPADLQLYAMNMLPTRNCGAVNILSGPPFRVC